MENEFRIILLRDIETFISYLSPEDQDKISGAIRALRNKKFDSIYIKQLRGDIKELRVKKIRLIFFIHKETVYFVRILIKKTNKTPKNEIDMAEKNYKLITN
ncbi:MAG: type II toxin-antitoxin system RelE/ParE family toxin [Patescibacteria group bacterium]